MDDTLYTTDRRRSGADKPDVLNTKIGNRGRGNDPENSSLCNRMFPLGAGHIIT